MAATIWRFCCKFDLYDLLIISYYTYSQLLYSQLLYITKYSKFRLTKKSMKYTIMVGKIQLSGLVTTIKKKMKLNLN